MKILSIGNFGTGWDGSICDEEHIAKALEDMGHEVGRYQREDANEHVAIPIGYYNLVLIAQWDGYPEQFMEVISQLQCLVVYWAFDYQPDGQEWHERLVRGADIYLSKRLADSKYPNWHWLSQDFAPMFLNKVPFEVKKDIDVLFTGSYLDWATERNEIVKAVDEKFNLTVHSVTTDEWTKQGIKNSLGPAMDASLPELIARAKINLSIDHTIEAGYWSDRNAQIMACGGFVLFRYIPMSEVAFHDNIEYFNSKEDCLGKIEAYLEVPKFCENIAEMGYKYARFNLMVKNRVEDMLIIVEQYL